LYLFIDLSSSSENTTRAKWCACRVCFASTQKGSDRAENVQLPSFMNWLKPACSTNYPIRNGYMWMRKFACSYWVAYSSDWDLNRHAPHYPMTNGYMWMRKFACSYWVAYSSDCRLRKVI
jgi:hypothetical protein